MNRAFAAACGFVLCACLGSGCGGSHRNALATGIGYGPLGVGGADPPSWLAKVVEREARLFGAENFHTIEYHFGKHNDVAQMFGRFETPPPVACTTSYCPVPVRLRGWNLRLVVSTRTHRILSARIGQRIAHAQAPEIARRSSPFFHIFQPLPGRITCSIPRGGPGSVHFRGRCTTEFVSAPPYRRGEIRIGFIERWREGHRLHHGGWIVTVGLGNGRVLGVHITGKIPPQLWM